MRSAGLSKGPTPDSFSAAETNAEHDELAALVVTDDPYLRESLHEKLQDTQVHIIGDADYADWEQTTSEQTVEVVLWDGPGPNQAELTSGPPIDGLAPRIIALVDDDDAARQALVLGAQGVLERNSDRLTLCAAAEATCRGLLVLDGAFAAVLPGRGDVVFDATDEPAAGDLNAEQPSADQPAAAERSGLLPSGERLTPREDEVMELLAQGLSNPEIAAALGVTVHTAKFHVTAILNKLGAQTRTEAVVLAARIGIITL